MRPAEHQAFTERLRAALAADPRVLGLVALGSMSGEPPAADEWSDHDFFVITAPGAQEAMRTGLSWLPDSAELVFSFRETAHGVKALYRSGHLLELAVFDRAELELARINRFGVLLDRTGGALLAQLQALRARTAAEAASGRPELRWLAGQLVCALLVGGGRTARGETLAGRARVLEAAGHFARLCAAALPAEQPGALDSLDPLRRFEQAFPALGAELERALAAPGTAAALGLLRLASRVLGRIDLLPLAAAEAVERALAGPQPGP